MPITCMSLGLLRFLLSKMISIFLLLVPSFTKKKAFKKFTEFFQQYAKFSPIVNLGLRDCVRFCRSGHIYSQLLCKKTRSISACGQPIKFPLLLSNIYCSNALFYCTCSYAAKLQNINMQTCVSDYWHQDVVSC